MEKKKISRPELGVCLWPTVTKFEFDVKTSYRRKYTQISLLHNQTIFGDIFINRIEINLVYCNVFSNGSSKKAAILDVLYFVIIGALYRGNRVVVIACNAVETGMTKYWPAGRL